MHGRYRTSGPWPYIHDQQNLKTMWLRLLVVVSEWTGNMLQIQVYALLLRKEQVS